MVMAIMDTLKDTVNSAVNTISSVTQSLVEKNRTKAKLNRLRLVMKNESEMMNRAYIALGKQYYEMQKKGDIQLDDKQKQLFKVIEDSKAKIARARNCYRTIVESRDEFIYKLKDDAEPKYEADDIVDITVACSNESEYESSPFEAVADAAEKVCESAEKKAEELKDAAKETAEELKDAAKETAEEFKDSAKETAEAAAEKVSAVAEDALDTDELF